MSTAPSSGTCASLASNSRIAGRSCSCASTGPRARTASIAVSSTLGLPVGGRALQVQYMQQTPQVQQLEPTLHAVGPDRAPTAFVSGLVNLLTNPLTE